MSIIDKRKRKGFWNLKSPSKVIITLDGAEREELKREKSIVLDLDCGRFRLSVPLVHEGELTSDIIRIDQLPRATQLPKKLIEIKYEQ